MAKQEKGLLGSRDNMKRPCGGSLQHNTDVEVKQFWACHRSLGTTPKGWDLILKAW